MVKTAAPSPSWHHTALRLLTALCLTATALLLIGCATEGEVARVLRQLASQGEEFDLAAVTPFPWERCAFLSPYTTRAKAEELLHVDWPNFSALGIEVQDSFHLLACSADGEVTGFARLERGFRFADGTTNRALLAGATLRNIGQDGALLLEAPQRFDLSPFDYENSPTTQ